MDFIRKYQHGGDTKAFAKAINCHPQEVIDLSSNINFIKPKIDIDFNTLTISSYPNYDELYRAIAHLYGVKISQIELFNGATSAIYSLFRELDLTHCTLYAPCYLEYKKAANLYGYEIDLVNRLENIEQEIKAKSLVVFVNPSTPDGKFYTIEKLMQRWIEQQCTILIDESFLDFTTFTSATQYLEYPNLYIIKSMTKFYSSAGIRIGAIISNRENILSLQKKEPLWKLSQFDNHYLLSALKDKEFIQISHNINSKNKNYLIEQLKQSNHIKKIYPSSANFIMVKLKNIDSKTFQKLLIPYKIMVRDCSNFDFLDEYFVRIAIKDIMSLKLLKKVLQKRV